MLCPECGVKRENLVEMLEEPDEMEHGVWMQSQNKGIALHIISGCEKCKEYFKEK